MVRSRRREGFAEPQPSADEFIEKAMEDAAAVNTRCTTVCFN